MIVTIRTLSVLLLLLCLAACDPANRLSRPRYRLLDTITISARNNPLDIFRETSPKIWELVHTDVQLRFDFNKKEAFGTAIIKIVPYLHAADTLVLDAKSMIIESVAFQPGMSNPDFQVGLPFSYDSLQLKIPVKGLDFGRRDAPQTYGAFTIAYRAMPYAHEAGGSKAISEDRGLYFINTDGAIPGKPVQIWTQGETESNSHWLPTIDKPNQRTLIDLSLIVPDTMQTLSNGRIWRSTPMDSGMRRDDWRMDRPIQVYAIMFAIGRFAVAHDVWKDASNKEREVSYYTEPAYGPYARGMFKHTTEMMDYFSKVTGVEYPWNKYSQVVVRDYVSGAMENTTASLFGEWMNQNSRQLLDEGTEDVVAHELFHQWFGDYVTAESWSHLTLNESFATYGQQLWRRHKYGDASADELAFNDLETYLLAAENADPPLVRFHYRKHEDMFDRVSYQKGGVILRYMHSLIGDSLFTKAMRLYLTRHALQSAEAANWRLALEEVTGRDWKLFFNQWYDRGGHPVLRVHYDYEDAAGKLHVTVRQASSPDSSLKYTLPLKAAIITGSTQRTEEWMIRDRTHSFTFDYQNGVRPIVIPDPAHVLPGVIKENKTPAEWLIQLKSTDHYTSKRQAVNGAMADQKDPVSLTILQLGLTDKLTSIREHTLKQIQRIKAQPWRESMTQQVAFLLETDGSNKVRSAALNVLGAWKVKSELTSIVRAVSDSSYLVAGSALNALGQLDADSAYAVAHRILPTEPKGWLLPATWSAIVLKGDPADVRLFEARSQHAYGAVKSSLAANLQRYAKAVEDDSVYSRTLRLILQMAGSEPLRTYRYAIGSNLFELNKYYDDEAGGHGETAARAKTRRNITVRFTEIMIAEEQDEENRRLYKQIGG